MRSRRSTRAFGVLLVVAALVGAGCASDDDGGGDEGADAPTTAAPDEAAASATALGTVAGPPDGTDPVAGDRLVLGLEAEPEGLDPTRYAFSSSGNFVASAVIEPLTTLDEEARPVPYLAESVEPSNDDFTEWTITIPEGVTFHDGTPFTADVVVQNLEAYQASIITGSSLSMLEGAEATSETEVVVTLSEPYAAFDAAMATQIGYMLAPAMIENPAYTLAPVGTGPFVFESHVPNESWVFTRNPDYRVPDRPYLDSIEFQPIIDNVERLDALESGDVDAVILRSAAEIGAIQGSEEWKQVENGAGEEDFLALNTEVPPFDDLTARRAVAAATDTQRWRDEVGGGTPADSPFAEGQLGHIADNGYPAFDLEEARALVAEYEETTGEPLAFTLRTQADTNIIGESQLLEQMYEDAGMEVEVEALPQINHVAQIAAGNYQMGRFRLFSAPNPDVDANAFWRSWSVVPPPGISLNFPRYASDAVDEAVRRAAATEDPAVRDEAYQAVNRVFAEEVPYLWLGRATWMLAASPRVNGIYAGANGTVQTITAKTWLTDVWLSQ